MESLSALERLAVVETELATVKDIALDTRDIVRDLRDAKTASDARWGVLHGGSRYLMWAAALGTGYLGSKFDTITAWLYNHPK